METPLVRYTLLTLAGSALWCFAFAGIGWIAGDNWEEFHHAFRYFDYLVAAGIVAVAAWLVVRYVRRRRMREQAQDA
jgi:membrane protein DedA with SNARE-associated domain